VLDAANACPGFHDLSYKKLVVLFFLRFQFEKPAFDLGPRLNLGRIQENPHPFSVLLVIKGQGITAYIDDRKPAVPDGAGREKLYGIGQTFGSFRDCIKQPFFGEVLVCQFYHGPADQYARSRKTMKGPNPLYIFLKGIGTNVHQKVLLVYLVHLVYLVLLSTADR
jgi:hypothetical protein